jgi:hypothetical protein
VLQTALDFTGTGPGIEARGADGPDRGPLRSDTGELTWRTGDAGGLVTVDTARTKAVVGRLRGRTVELDGLKVSVPADGPPFAAITVTAMDDKPLVRSDNILITAVGRVENTGMVWNEDHTSVSDRWGTAPTVAEGIAAELEFSTSRTVFTFAALDGRGQVTEPHVLRSRDDAVTVRIGPEHKTLWYTLGSAASAGGGGGAGVSR